MHLDEERVQRLLHGELTAPVEASLREHLSGCADCRLLLEAARTEEDNVLALLRRVDHAPPAIDAAAVLTRARAARGGWGRWAAGIVAVLALAGAAYAGPGSPLASWVRNLAQGDRGPAVSPARPESASPDSGAAGIAFAPGPELLIWFASEAGGTAEISLTADSLVLVRTVAGTATFISEEKRLVIEQPAPAEFEILIPRGAPRLEIRVGRRRVFLKVGSRVVTDQGADARGAFVLDLTP
jgi:hypothetical protein